MKSPSKSGFGLNLPILIPAAVIGLVGLAQALPQFFPRLDSIQRLEGMTYDWRMRLAAHHSEPYATNLLAGVFITDQDLKEMNDGKYGYHEKFPWPTHYYGMVARELARQRARVVGFDILFELLNPEAKVELPDGTMVESDKFFAAQLREAGNAVLATDAEGEIFPADVFRTNAALLGNIFTRRDADSVLRRVKAFSEHRVWQPDIAERVRPLSLDLAQARIERSRIIFPRTDGEAPFEIPLKRDGSLRLDGLTGKESLAPQWPYVTRRVWNLGLLLAARELKLDLDNAVVEPGQIILRGPGGVERRIPTDPERFFYIDWRFRFNDPRIYTTNILGLIRADHWRGRGDPDLPSPFRGKLVILGSTGTGGNIADLGATPLEREAPLVMEHLNVANAVLGNRFIRRSSYLAESALILLMTAGSALLSWKSRIVLSSLSVLLGLAVYSGLSIALFAQYRYWLPLVLPVLGAFLTHFCMITYRGFVENKERRRIRSIFSKLVSPHVVHELLKTEDISLGGARRKVTVYFADIRGFTRMADEVQARADEYIRAHRLPPSTAEAYRDQQAGDLLATVNLYLSAIADTIKTHNGTLDKYIGDCVLAFWGAPVPNERHAPDCVRAAISAQRAVYELNLQRVAENRRQARENAARVAAGQLPLPLLSVLALGSGINTGTVTVGLMGSDAHFVSYTVFGREVNLASRLEGVSGRGRIIISDSTYQEIHRLDAELAATCIELPPQEVKGFREVVKIYEVQWRPMESKGQGYDTSLFTRAGTAPPLGITSESV